MRIGKKHQVVVPTEVMQAAHLEGGDQVWFVIPERPAGCILLLPAELVDQVWSTGWRQLLDEAGSEEEPGSQ